MKMHLADAGTYSCHSLPAELRDTVPLWMHLCAGKTSECVRGVRGTVGRSF